MALSRRPSKRANVGIYYFYDDFGGSVYENRVWSTRGTGSLALQTDGSIRVRATANLTYEMYHNDLPDFSVAALATIISRFRLSSITNIQGEVGFEGAFPDNTTDWITLYYDSAVGPNWQAQSSASSVATTVDTGILASTSYIETQITCKPGEIVFFLNGNLVATINTNISTLLLQPYAFIISKTAATKDLFFDWLECIGERE